MENFGTTTSPAAAKRWERVRRFWAPYQACPDCHAVAGNPCRNPQLASWPGSPTIRRAPHPNWPKKPTDAK